MLDREASVPTYMGNFLAIPHGTTEAKHQIRRSALSVIRYDEPVERCSGCSTPRPPPSCMSGCRRSTHHKAVMTACENAINATDQLYDEIALRSRAQRSGGSSRSPGVRWNQDSSRRSQRRKAARS